MTHEPECFVLTVPNPSVAMCICERLRAAYQRGFAAGYNDHARSQQHWQDTHGAYRPTRSDEERRTRLERGETA